MRKTLRIVMFLMFFVMTTPMLVGERSFPVQQKTVIQRTIENIPVYIKKKENEIKALLNPIFDKNLQVGVVSYYRYKTISILASGQKYTDKGFYAAHKTLPFGTKLKVTRADNLKSIEVVVNDRGPYYKNRILDLNFAAGKELGIANENKNKQLGIATCLVEVLNAEGNN